jgi:glycosyltransferase involved in cell wall biosynthesis
MRIAIVHPSLGLRRGADRVGMWLAEGLARRGYSILLITAEYNDELYGARDQLPFQLIEVGGPGYGNSGLVELVQLGHKLGDLLQACDLVVASNYPTYQWVYFARVSRRSLAPVVWLCYEPPRVLYDSVFNQHAVGVLPSEARRDSLGRWLREKGLLQTLIHRPGLLLPNVIAQGIQRVVDQQAVRAIEHIVSISAFSAELTQRIYGRQDVPVCPVGIPIPEPHNDEPSSGSYLLTASPLMRIKNVETIIRAVHLLAQSGRFAGNKYVIAGDGSDRTRLVDLVADLNLQEVVEFRGFVSDDELQQLYHHAKAVAYLPFDEPFGLVFLEAAAFAVPVIAPNHGGALEIVVDGVTGYLVEPSSVESVAEVILCLLTDDALSKRLGQAGRARFHEMFTIESFLDRFEALALAGTEFETK